MGNLTESNNYEPGIYRIETTDPIIGGENGISNIQAKQLASRTKYLKERADQVDAAAAGFGSLLARLQSAEASLEAMGPEMQSALAGAVQHLYDLAGRANDGVHALRYHLQQEGTINVTNRGVVDGCSITKSATATRNLNISAGHCFAKGAVFPVGENLNAASVPSNPGPGAVSVFAYLYPGDGYGYALAVTAPGEDVPENAIILYSLQIPAGNTDATDPQLGSVTLTDLRRLEPDFPTILREPVMGFIEIYPFRDGNYRIDFDVRSYTGGHLQREDITVHSVAPNGFTLVFASDSDDAEIFLRLSKLNN